MSMLIEDSTLSKMFIAVSNDRIYVQTNSLSIEEIPSEHIILPVSSEKSFEQLSNMKYMK
jgi:hypothetical protein